MVPPVTDLPDKSDSHSDAHSVVVEPTPAPVTDPSEPPGPTADTQTVVLDPTLGPVGVDPAVPMSVEDAAVDASLPEIGPRHWADTWLGPIRRMWSHRWTKVAVLCLAAAVAVILVIWGIRLTHTDSGSGGPTVPPPSTTTTRPATSHTAPTAFVAPLNSAQLAQYEQYAAGLQAANGLAAKGFAGAGSTATSTQLAPVAAAYRTAVNLYDFQLRFIQWPASMQPAIQVDHAQLEALVSLLTSYPAVSPAGTSAWLAGIPQLGRLSGDREQRDPQGPRVVQFFFVSIIFLRPEMSGNRGGDHDLETPPVGAINGVSRNGRCPFALAGASSRSERCTS